MDIYMVERELPGVTPEQLVGAQGAAISTSQQFTARGTTVRYIRSTFVPDESKCFCLFEAASQQAVLDVNTAAKLPFTRIVRALELTPAVMVIFTVLILASACGRSPVAPSHRADVAIAPATTLPSTPAAACTNIDATVTATLQGGTALGSISGDITGGVTATISQITASGDGNGAFRVLMEHHYTNASPFGRLDTSDHAVLAPSDKSDGVYRMNNKVDHCRWRWDICRRYRRAGDARHRRFGTGAIDLTLKGRVCR